MGTQLVYKEIYGESRFGFFETIFPILFIMFFIFIFGAIIYSISSAVKQNHKNNRSPVLMVEAEVVSKRTNISHHSHNHNNMVDNNINSNFTEHSTSTSYYTTFQVESGDRIEFHVQGSEYGMLVEGDKGKLKFQGTRFLDFTRV